MNRLGLVVGLLLVACSSSPAPAEGDTEPVSDAGSDALGASSVDAARGPVGGGAQDSGTMGNGPLSDASGAAPAPDGATALSDAGGDGSLTAMNGCTPTSCGSVSGFVQRTSTLPKHGGIGNVYVAVFNGDPITSASTATVIGEALLSNENMSAATAQVAYQIDFLPIQSSPYQVIAFLDDANAVVASNPAPASGDLVSLDTTSTGFGGYPLTVSNTKNVTLNLQLNVAMP